MMVTEVLSSPDLSSQAFLSNSNISIAFLASLIVLAIVLVVLVPVICVCALQEGEEVKAFDWCVVFINVLIWQPPSAGSECMAKVLRMEVRVCVCVCVCVCVRGKGVGRSGGEGGKVWEEVRCGEEVVLAFCDEQSDKV